MKVARILIVLVLLIVPSVVRSLWFYQGRYSKTAPVPTPDYASLSMSVPVLATPQAEKISTQAPGKIVLVDRAHKNQFDLTELDFPTRALTGMGARLEIMSSGSPSQSISSSASSPASAVSSASPNLSMALKHADAYVVIAPNAPFTPDEAQQVQGFVAQGGRLLVIADPTRGARLDSITSANSLLVPFDLVFSDDYLYNLIEYEGNYRNVLFKRFADDPLTKGLRSVALYASHSVGTTTGTPLIQGDENTLSSRTDTGGNLIVMALSANRQVLALGDLTFLTAPYYQIADNTLLINHLAEFLVSGQRTTRLADFPFIFKQPVTILPTRNITLSAELAASVSKLQSSLASTEITATVASEAPQDSDLIVLGYYTPSDDLTPYLKPLVLVPTIAVTSTLTRSATVSVPGAGQIARSNTGAMLFSRTDERTTLVLLADNSDALSSLISILASGDSSACAIQEQMALCGLAKPKPEQRSSP